ncbi:MAG TPA: catalase family peroxidase [Acidimicrobiia bacterium]
MHAGRRAAHAKGVLCTAEFSPSPSALAVSRAAHLSTGAAPYRAHVRFSNGSGNPDVPDGQRDARGMAVKWYLPDGSTTDVVAISLPAFFARSPQDLLDFNAARRPDPATGAPDPAAVGEYLGRHPEALPAVEAAITHPIPASYAHLDYHALHTYWLVDADDHRRAGRLHLVADEELPPLSDEDAAAASPDYLHDELAERFARAPVVFHLEVTLAAPEDPVDDSTAVWPDDRIRHRLGSLVITSLAFDRERDGDILVFDPTRVTDGVECSNDPILLARSGAYSVSVLRRTTNLT